MLSGCWCCVSHPDENTEITHGQVIIRNYKDRDLMSNTKHTSSSPLGVDMDNHEITFANGTFFRQVMKVFCPCFVNMLFQNPSSGWKFFGDVIFTNVILRYAKRVYETTSTNIISQASRCLNMVVLLVA